MKEKFLKFSHLAAIWLFWPALGVVIWGELTPLGNFLPVWDKLLHFTAYFGLSGLAVVALAGRPRRPLWAAVGLVVLGAALELIQGRVGRDMSAYDELANTLGVLAGLGLGRVYLGLLRGRLVGRKAAD